MAGRRRPWKAAALASAGCSLLFVVVYSTTNAVAASRDDVGTFAWDWERHLPLIEWLIVPYMSIDAFFVVAPFVCTSVREVKLLAKRICTAILVAGAFFLAWPLRLVFPRPEVAGFLAPVFDFLHGFDQPYNLFPSLHIALIFILRWTYHRHVRGPWRLLMHSWFGLVTLSTLFTHQHQVIDLVGGLVLAVLIFYVFPTGLIAQGDPVVDQLPGVRLAGWYGGGALLSGLLAWAASTWSWTMFWLLVWVAVALLLVALGYGRLGPRVFRKYQGYLSLPARILLWPYLLPLWLSRLWYWRQEPRPYAEIGDGVIFGRLPDEEQARDLLEAGVDAVLDLCAEHSETRLLRRTNYLNLPILDLTMPEPDTLNQAVEFLREHDHDKVYVHCALGYERSAVVVAAWLLRTRRVPDVDAAIAAVRVARSHRIPASRLREVLTATA